MTREQKIMDLQKKILQASKKGDYIKIINYQRELEALMQEVESMSLGSVVHDMSVDDHYQAVCLMVRMFIFADMLYGAAVDFKDFLKKYEITDVPIASLAADTAKNCHNITREIDALNDDELSERFGDICDECNMMVMNKVYTAEAGLKENIRRQHGG